MTDIQHISGDSTKDYLATLTSSLFDEGKLANIANKDIAVDYLIYTLAKDVSVHHPNVMVNTLKVLDVVTLKDKYSEILEVFIQHTLNQQITA